MLRTVKIAAFSVLLAGSAVAGPLPDVGVPVKAPSVVASQAGTTDLFACPAYLRDAYARSGMPRGDSVAVLRAIETKVRRTIRYRKDPGADVWTNFAVQALEGKRVFGDCEDFATTTITLALCAGVPAEKLGVAMSSQSGSLTSTDHAFAYYVSDKGVMGVADTSRGRMSRVSPKRDKVTMWQSVPQLLAEPGVFRAAVNPRKR